MEGFARSIVVLCIALNCAVSASSTGTTLAIEDGSSHTEFGTVEEVNPAGSLSTAANTTGTKALESVLLGGGTTPTSITPADPEYLHKLVDVARREIEIGKRKNTYISHNWFYWDNEGKNPIKALTASDDVSANRSQRWVMTDDKRFVNNTTGKKSLRLLIKIDVIECYDGKGIVTDISEHAKDSLAACKDTLVEGLANLTLPKNCPENLLPVDELSGVLIFDYADKNGVITSIAYYYGNIEVLPTPERLERLIASNTEQSESIPILRWLFGW